MGDAVCNNRIKQISLISKKTCSRFHVIGPLKIQTEFKNLKVI